MSHQIHLNWSAPKRQMTVRGEKMVSEAAPTKAFWDLWRTAKSELIEAGYSVRKFGESWIVYRYQPLPKEEQEAKAAKAAASREASRATDADVSIPAPAGLSYLPYQRAGIAFALSRKATLFGDDMGLGKSCQALGTAVISDGFPMLVVCPASLKLNWKNECAKFLPGEGAVVLFQGKPKADFLQGLVGLLSLDDQIGSQGTKEGRNVNRVVQGKLIARLPEFFSVWRLPLPNGHERAVKVPRDELHHCLVSVVKGNAPVASAVADDRSLAIQEARDVGQYRNVGGHRKPREALVSTDEPASAIAEVARQSTVAYPQVSCHSRDGGSLSNPGNGIRHDARAEFLPSARIECSGNAASHQQITQSRTRVANIGRNVRQGLTGIDAGGQGGENVDIQTTGRHVVLVVNYDVLPEWLPLLAAIGIRTIVFDEVHYAKSPKARRSKACLALVAAKKDSRVLALTGTPIMNRPIELVTPLKILGCFKTLFGSWFAFAQRHCAAHQTSYGWDVSGASHLGELQDRLRETVMIRRLKSEVLKELPPKVWQIIELPAESAEEKAAIAAESALRERMVAEIEKLSVLAALAAAGESEDGYKQAVENLRNAQLVAFTEMAKARKATGIAKLPQAMTLVEEALEASKKLIVFAHHHTVIDALQDRFGDICVKIDGRNSLDARDAAVKRFQEDTSAKLFIGQITAAGVGLTLTAASHVIFLEQDWTPGAMQQAADRAHRIGQKSSVLVQNIVLEGSIDAHMARTVSSKQNVINAALDKETIARHQAIYDNPIELDLDALLEAAASRVAAEEERQAARTAERAEAAREVEERREQQIKAINAKREALVKAAAKLTPAQILAVHDGLRHLEAMNQDRAQIQNMRGFNRVDTRIGAELSAQSYLTPLQAALGAKVLKKYRRQLDPGLYDTIYDEEDA